MASTKASTGFEHPTDDAISAVRSSARRELRTALLALDDVGREVLERHYGLNGFEPQTLEEIGRQLGRSREQVRQLESEVLERLSLMRQISLMRRGGRRFRSLNLRFVHVARRRSGRTSVRASRRAGSSPRMRLAARAGPARPRLASREHSLLTRQLQHAQVRPLLVPKVWFEGGLR
jgi:Sigma-70, region 4